MNHEQQYNHPRADAASVDSSGLIGWSRDLAIKQYEKYRQQLEECDRKTLEALAMLCLQKRSVDGMNGRVWSASAHMYFDEAVESVLQSMESTVKVIQSGEPQRTKEHKE